MATGGAAAAVDYGPDDENSANRFNGPPFTGGVDVGVRDYNPRGWWGDFDEEEPYSPLSTASTEDLINLRKFISTEPTEKKFNNRCRLFIRNMPPYATVVHLREIFAPYGEIRDAFVKKGQGYGFLRTATRALAEKARNELNKKLKFLGRIIQVDYAVTHSTIKVKNLHPLVTNELLKAGFKEFGEVERAVVICDEAGISTGEGIVEYQFDHEALTAVKRCSDGAFFLSKTLLPVIVELSTFTYNMNGLSEKSLMTMKRNEYRIERSVGPRFAERGSVEEQYANRWKENFSHFEAKFELLKLEQKREQAEIAAEEHLVNYYRQETENMEQQVQDLSGQQPNGGSSSQNNENFNPCMAGQGPFIDQRVVMPLPPNEIYYFKWKTTL